MMLEERFRQPKQHYTEHVVKEMDTSMIQRCELCEEIISDYRFCLYPAGQNPPKGFPAGSVFITQGNPQYFTVILGPDDTFEKCKNSN